MLKVIKAVALQKNQLIKDVRKAKMRENFKGLPSISSTCVGC